MTTEARQPDAQTTHHYQIAISFETLIILVLVAVAAAIRWISLGAAPLSGAEAPQAIAAWHLLEPVAAPGTGIIDSILVFVGAVASFAVSGPSAASARFVPAIAGFVLVLSPLLFRHRLGSIGTIICMAILAVSPSAVIDSRQMTGAGIAMLGIIGALAAIDRYQMTRTATYAILAGVSLAITLLADFGTLAIVLMLAAGAALAIFTDEEGELSGEALQDVVTPFPWTAAAIGLGTTVVLLGTLFYLAPSGLANAADQIARFFGGLITRPPDTPYLGIVLLAYEPFLLIFGIIAAWPASQSPRAWHRFLAGWAIASVVISLAYPGAVPAHGIWAVVPLAAVSSLMLAGMLRPVSDQERLATALHAIGMVGFTAMLAGNLHRQLSSPQVIPISTTEFVIPYNIILMVMAVVLAVVTWLAIASVWGPGTAWSGVGLGSALVGLGLSLGLASAAAFTRPTSPFELYYQAPADPGLEALVTAAEDVSLISAQDRHDASIIVLGNPNGILAWALKDFHNVQYVASIPATTQSVMVITPAEGDHPELGSDYVGQSLVVMRRWSMDGMDLPRFLNWLVYRDDTDSSVIPDRVIMWVREDVYQLVPKSDAPK